MDNQIQPKSKKKIIAVVVFLIILIAVGYLIGTEINQWWQVRKEYVKMGYASDKFPFRMYTAEELAEKGLWPEALPSYDAIPTRTRPEETYVKFREALIDGNLDKAIECFDEHYRTDWRKSLHEIKDKGFLQEMIDDLPEKLEDIYIYNEGAENRNLNKTSLTSYDYVLKSDSERIAQTMSFVKDKNGDWLIEDL